MAQPQLPILVFSSRVDILFSDSECEVEACTFEILSLDFGVISSSAVNFVHDVVMSLDVNLTPNTFEQLRWLLNDVFTSPRIWRLVASDQ